VARRRSRFTACNALRPEAERCPARRITSRQSAALIIHELAPSIKGRAGSTKIVALRSQVRTGCSPANLSVAAALLGGVLARLVPVIGCDSQ
jgi:hypothetical protein